MSEHTTDHLATIGPATTRNQRRRVAGLRRGWRWVVWPAVVALLAAAVVAAGGTVAAQEQTGDDEGAVVRVVARRLADDRIEFALQQRRSDATWGSRQLPRSRFFPADAAVGRWLVSSPLSAGDATVRIVARRLTDGRTEFGARVRAGGSWGQRLLPSKRFFPTTATVGRWLRSSPLQLGATAGAGAAGQCPTGTTEETWVGASQEEPGTGASVDFWRTADVARVRLELRCGADANATVTSFPFCGDDCGPGDATFWTPLRRAALNSDDPAVIQALVDAGADLEATSDGPADFDIYSRGDTALHFAARNENPAVIRVLVDAGANIEAGGPYTGTPLHVAASNDNPAVIRVLLDAGANVRAMDISGRTPLEVAREAGNDAAVRVLETATGS